MRPDAESATDPGVDAPASLDVRPRDLTPGVSGGTAETTAAPAARWGPRAAKVAVFATVFLALVAFDRASYAPESGWVWSSPVAGEGDEPHYVLALNSVLNDGDLDLRQDYDRVLFGGLDAGSGHGGENLDHHTLVIDRARGRSVPRMVVYHFTNPVLLCREPGCARFPRKLLDFPMDPVAEVPIHTAFYPLIVSALLLPFSPALADVESAANIVTVLLCCLGLLATYAAARRVGYSRRAALAVVFLAGLASPWLPYTRGFFSEPLIGVALAVALWALVDERPVVAGVALSIAFALKPPFVLVGAAWVAERLFARRVREAILLGGTLLAGGAALVAFNYWLAGTWLISVGFDWTTAPWDTWVGSKHGLFVFAPWAALGLAHALLASRRDGDLAPRIGWALAPMAIVFTAKGGPGWCYGPRFWVPLIPYLALATIAFAQRVRPARLTVGVAAAWSLVVAVTGSLGYLSNAAAGPLETVRRLLG